MPSDRTYSHGGAMTVSGNYLRENGVASQFLRLVTMALARARGQGGWVASPEKEAAVPQASKYDENAENTIRQIVEIAARPLVKSGKIGDLEIEVEAVTAYAVGFTASYTDKTTGDSYNHELSAPWVG